MNDRNNKDECNCGRGSCHEQFDFYGIYAGRMCDLCFEEKYKQNDYEHDEELGDITENF